MKKLLLALLTGVISVSLIGSGAESASAAGSPKQVEVLLNTIKMKFPDAKPFQDAQGSVMVPIRFVSEALGAKVTYSKEGKVSKVGVYSKDHKVDMTIGQTSALVNGQKKDYGTQIILKQNRTFVPLRLVSEGLGEKVEWDKIGRWVWIGNKEFRSTDDKEFKLTKLSDFKAYTKSDVYFKNIKGNRFSGIKIIKESDLPLQLGNSQIVYSIDMVKRKVTGRDLVQIRSSHRGNPIAFLMKNNHVKGRSVIDVSFVNNGDKTGMNYYPVISESDKFQNGEYISDYTDWMNFKVKQSDYILLEDGDLVDYAVAIVNPFK
ncbi:copper amine oxidase N-terminal domain-containing protein [Paenibacillus silvae]|uniref:copper amine oxidase N-terminal domain-containing protein n=1 Tax=Paenibacillus silvae TaxID=1325358 RepID=UPI0011A6609A|nr:MULTISPECIES: copper amine oxidase N-terminal domain-containing protein [Paenibacillus]MCK6077403.1 copper amine oxidase N-terminal domain-containing protein [Paenibacillus silvae]MCK6151483.1 copper amine oxidase N-terminal domain-containing protein [Paenibacillus silvae]MCK6270088.1 copper amine oxidase N-terminal domain-containing protein [Paenibacillus silvae]